ncbi:hypothetical protein CASFOL_024156 [Castilleja foliolosa]|uniref:Uncharacterized protein n=1 Tax=Castilleja foliolosa TaxID=1961234 RepID=A0ABD3CRF4_9LAMI
MASDSETAPSFMETLINSRNRDISLFLPFTLALNAMNPPHQETQNQDNPRDRIVLINSFTQNMTVIETDSLSSLGFGSLFDGKNGRRYEECRN